MKKIILLFICAAMLWPSPISFAGPKGGKVVGGNAQIKQNGASTTINQTTDRAIINWNSFDINKNESVRHNMPSSSSAGLHRVVGGGGASQIAGSLQSNGNIYLVNPAGVVIHNGAKIDVNGFVATSRDISDQNFMKGNMVFDKPGHPDAKIINKGNITLKDNGLAVLVAPTARNDGVIAGKLGKVALGGSDAAWKLDMTGDDLIAFTLDEKAVNTLHSTDGTPLASVENNGQIKAKGGVVVMSAAQLDGFVGSVVNNGEISAASVESKGGKIIFRGQGDRVDLVNNDKLDVSSQSGDGGIVRMAAQAEVANVGRIDATGTKGGKVVLTGKDVTLKSGSVIDASGKNGGGTVLVGGNAKGKGPEPNAKTVTVKSDAEIFASATQKGDGGQVVVWADEKTQFDGKIEAKGGEQGGDGGFIETSAKLLIIGDSAVVNTSAQKGDIGEWLLDPNDFVISKTGGDITGKNLSENLKLTSITIDSSQGTFDGNGDIFVNDEIYWSSDSQLSLIALNSIYILNDISASGDNAKLVLRPIQSLYITNSKINLTSSSQKLIISGKEYTIINDITDLQNIEDDLYYKHPRLYIALGNDIDASSTLSWNDGKGFRPLGDKFNFTGHFNGLGHTINNLYINRPDEDNVGIFKILGYEQNETAHISNLNLKNINIVGKNYVGSIAGKLGDNNISGNISNVAISGKIQGMNYVGGLAGYNDFRIINVCIGASNDGEATIVKGLDRVGGITGHNIYTIERSEVRDTIVDGSNIVGGLTGFNSGEIKQSFVNASVRGYEYIGGFVGIIDSSEFNGSTLVPTHNAKISNSYVVGKVVFDTTGLAGNLNPFGGGFAGGVLRDALIENSYAAVTVEYDTINGGKFGGFIGEAYGPVNVKNSYWDKELCGVDIAVINSSEGVNGYPDYSNLSGLTTAEMREEQSFPNWDFKNIWILDAKSDYPELRFPQNRVSVPTKPIETDKPDAPVTPSQPSNSSPSTPSNSTPSRPTTSNPVTPNNPQTSTSSSNSSSSESRPTIHYNLDNGNLYVYKDNINGVTTGGLPSLPASGINQPNNIYDVYEYDPYTATPDERQAFIDRIEREQAEEKAKYDRELAQAFEDAKRKNFPKIVNNLEQTVSKEIDYLKDSVVNLYASELTVMGTIFVEKNWLSSAKTTNVAAGVHSSLKTLLGTITRNGWGDKFRGKKYFQALTTKNYMSLYMLTIANHAREQYEQTDNLSQKLYYLCQMELATEIAQYISQDYSDVLYYIAVDAGKDLSKKLVNKYVVGKLLDDEKLKRIFLDDKSFGDYLKANTFSDVNEKVDLTKQISKGIFDKTKVMDRFLDYIGDQSKVDSIEEMVNRLMHSDGVNTIIENTMAKYNNLAQDYGLSANFPNGKITFPNDIRNCWYWDPEIAYSLNDILTSDLGGSKLGDAIGNIFGPTLGGIFGFKPKKEQLSNLYTDPSIKINFTTDNGS